MTDTDIETCGCSNRNDEPCELAAGWGTENDSGPCKFHGGASPGAPKGNANALKHGVQADPVNLYNHLPDEQRAWVDSLTAAYCDRGDIAPDDPRSERVKRACIHILQSLRGEEHILADGLSEETTIGVSDAGNPIVTNDGHHLHKHTLERDKEARMILKDLGLLTPPEQQQADAIQGLADAFAGMDEGSVIDI